MFNGQECERSGVMKAHTIQWCNHRTPYSARPSSACRPLSQGRQALLNDNILVELGRETDTYVT